MDEHMDTETDSPTSPTPNTSKPLKIRKKPGRKPNPASPAVRKAQNRAAQRAFRERQQRHMKDLEGDSKRLIQERDQYYNESQQLTKENDILKCENWYLKGIVLSLQMVCFKSKLRIPRHIPHIDERARQVMSSTTPPAMAAYLNGGGDAQQPVSPSSNSSNSNNGDHVDGNSGPTSHHGDHRQASRSQSNTNTTTNQDSSGDSITSSNNGDTEGDIQLTEPVMLNNHSGDVVSNNMAAIQALRFRLRIQSALFRENATAPYCAKPSALQMAVPHDARIDLIPTVHMRDRMILFRDQFDLDDCLRLLINEAVFHGGDPTHAGNWELPAVFFEKYWYLTTDYTMERTSQRWRQIKSMFNDDPTLASSPPPQGTHNPSPSTASLSPIPSHQESSFSTDRDPPSEEAQQRQPPNNHPSYYQHHPPIQQQQHWSSPLEPPFDQQNSNINPQEKHTTNSNNNNNNPLVHHPPQQSSLVPTDSDILALMTPAPSADVGPRYSPLPHSSPAPSSSSSSFANAHHYPNYDILSNVPPPSSSSISPLPSSTMHQGDFVFHDNPVTMTPQQQQQHLQELLQQGQHHHHQQQQQQHASQPPWNPSYSFTDDRYLE